MWNLPDDWNSYWHRCQHCNARYHASEGGCDCREDWVACSAGTQRKPCEAPLDQTLTIEDQAYCHKHAECVVCGASAMSNPPPVLSHFEGDLFCGPCNQESSDNNESPTA